MEIITRKEAQQQGLSHYFTGKPCKHGHIAKRYTSTKICFECDKARQTQLRQERPELVAERKKRAYEANKEQILLRQTAAVKARCATDHGYRLLLSHRKRLSRFLCQGDSRRVASCRELTGVGTTQLAKHIESQFAPGMTWASYGRDGWHLDHIRPCMSFDQTCPEQQALCWNWRNLQPLWATDNISKNDKWTPTMEAEWAQRMTDLGWEGELFLVFDQAVAA